MRSTRTFPLKSWRATAAWSGITKSCPMPNRLSSRSGLKLGCSTTNTASARTARVKKRPFHSLNFGILTSRSIIGNSSPTTLAASTRESAAAPTSTSVGSPTSGCYARSFAENRISDERQFANTSIWGNGSNGTKNSAKAFSFVDSSDSSRVKLDRGHHHRGVAPEGATRAATDRAVKDRKHPLYRCSGRTYLGNRLSPSSWPIDSQNRGRDRTELESNPPTSQRARRQGDSSLAEPTATIEPRCRRKEKSRTA